MTKIVTAPRRLTPRARLVHDTELYIRRVYDLGAIINLRQKRSIIENLLVEMLASYDALPASQHGGRYQRYLQTPKAKELVDATTTS